MIQLDLTKNEKIALAEVVDMARDLQGDGTRPNEIDDALVSLNDKLDRAAIIQGYSITVTDPDGDVLIKHDGLPTIYDVQGVVEEYIDEEVD